MSRTRAPFYTEGQELAMQAALAFDQHARQILAHRGERYSRHAMSRLLGLHPNVYGYIMNGRRLTLDMVARWLVAWHRAGYPELVLQVSATRADVWLRGPLDDSP